MKNYPTFEDASRLDDLEKFREDFNLLMYMLHYVDKKVFSKKELREVSFSVKVALNTIQKMEQEKSK